MSGNFFKLFAGILPVIFSVWNKYSDRPLVKSLAEAQEILEDRIYNLGIHIRWLYFFIIMLVIWNIIVSATLYINFFM
jgi:hypothetical protein